MVLELIRRCLKYCACGALFLMVGCTIDPAGETGQEIALPNDQLRLEEVLANDQFLFSQRSSNGRWNNTAPSYVLLSNGELNPLSLPTDASCLTGTVYQRPSLLPDGRLGFVKRCVRSLEAPVGER